MRWLALPLLLGLLALAFSAGRLSARRVGEPERQERGFERADEALIREHLLTRQMVSQLRQEVRQALADLAARPAPAAPAKPSEARQDAPPETSDQSAALADAERAIGDARRKGAWSEKDALALKETMLRLSDEGRAKIGQELSRAINAGQVRLDTPRPF